MRRQLRKTVFALAAIGLLSLTNLASGAVALPTARSQISLSQALGAQSQVPATALNREELRLRIDVTSKELAAAENQFHQLEKSFDAALTSTEQLEVETLVLGEETLEAAIEGYLRSEVPSGFLAANDLTASLRASTLRSAAVGSNTDDFQTFRDLKKDLEIEQEELIARQSQVDFAATEVASLQGRLENELLILGDMEERRLQNQAALVAVKASNRAQYRGRRQGFYLDTCPVNGPHSFIDSWGFARSGGRRHKGVDIIADTGIELVAPTSGVVEHFHNSIGGRSYRMTSDTGVYFYGTHMSAYGKEGRVRAGEVIGYVGEDGNAAGIPHLHFEIHPGGRGNPINPFIDSAAVCSGAQY